MRTTLRTQLNALAASFADGVLAAVRGASVEDLLAESGGAPRRGPGRPRGGKTTRSPKGKKPGRLARRSSEDIAKTLAQVVALVKGKKAGLRAEQIRAALQIDRREVPPGAARGTREEGASFEGTEESNHVLRAVTRAAGACPSAATGAILMLT